MKDQVFSEKLSQIRPFAFNEDVASVFDDMVSRSVPFYHEIHRIIIDIAKKKLPENAHVYDLGCSTGTTMSLLQEALPHLNMRFTGVDNSEAIIKKAQEKLITKVPNFDLHCMDLQSLEMQSCDLVIMNYTLQFIDKFDRPKLLKKIYDALRPGGVFIYAEKINCQTESTQDLFTDLYYDFKRRNGYSELEISQKREALENVLVPLTPEAQIELLKFSGFTKVDMIFKWYNFASFIGLK